MPDLESVQRFDLASGDLQAHRRTPQGGLVVDAHLTRTGVFEYRDTSGTARRELRPPEEVFHPDALSTFPHAPLTVDHPGKVTPENWRHHTVGHVASAARDGQFVAGEVHIQDARAIEDAEKGKLREVSCGYTCDLDPTPGEYKGERYDAVQRKIRVNHVALGPAGWGRMGPDVRLHLDSATALSVPDFYVSTIEGDMPTELEKAQAELQTANAALTQARADAANAKTETEKLATQAKADAAELTKLRAENQMLKLQGERNRSEQETAEAQEKADAKVLERATELTSLWTDARKIFATPEDPEGAKWKHDAKTPDVIRREVVAHLEPKMPLVRQDGKPLDGEPLSLVYKMAVDHWRRTEQARADAQAAAAGERKDMGAGGDDDGEDVDAEKARKAMVDRKRNDWKKKMDARRGRAA